MGQIILTCKKFFLTLFFFLISFQVFSKEAEKNNYGNYLSWNFARQTGDVDRIKDLFVNVKIHEIAPNLLEEVFFESVVFNEWSEARKISDFILKQDEINFTANLFNFVDEFLKKNDQSKKFIKKIDTNHFDSNFIKVLLLWSSNSIKEIDDINNNIDCIPLICLHSGIFLMLSNDKTKAENYFNKLLHSKFASYRIKELLLNNYLELKRFDVAENILNDLNELECVGDFVYANVWHWEWIFIIDLNSGMVVGTIDAAPLFPDPSPGVLNGIAYDISNDTFWLTGKYWPVIHQVQFRIANVNDNAGDISEDINENSINEGLDNSVLTQNLFLFTLSCCAGLLTYIFWGNGFFSPTTKREIDNPPVAASKGEEDE